MGKLQPYTARLQVSVGSGQGIKLNKNKVIKNTINLPTVGE